MRTTITVTRIDLHNDYYVEIVPSRDYAAKDYYDFWLCRNLEDIKEFMFSMQTTEDNFELYAQDGENYIDLFESDLKLLYQEFEDGNK